MNIAQVVAMPVLIRIPDWGAQNGMTRSQSYAAVDKMPASVKVRIGGRLRLHADRLRQYLNDGGDLAAGSRRAGHAG